MKDPALRSVSLSSKGLWIDLLCMMAESERRGYLEINGQAPSNIQLTRMVGCTQEELRGCLGELTDAGVLSSTKTGVIFSRRMVRDDNLSKLRKKCGEKGGNPSLKPGCPNPYYNKENDILVNQKDNLMVNQKDNQKITPSSSSSSSLENSNNIESSRELFLPILQSAKLTPEKIALEKEIMPKTAAVIPLFQDGTQPGVKDPVESKEVYETKKGRKLTGKKLADFERFWEAFDRHGNKKPAADSWLDIKNYSPELVEKIIEAAKLESERRPALEAKNQTPKYAQGWLSESRWADKIIETKGNGNGNGNGQRKLSETELKRAQEERNEAWERVFQGGVNEAGSGLPN